MPLLTDLNTHDVRSLNEMTVCKPIEFFDEPGQVMNIPSKVIAFILHL